MRRTSNICISKPRKRERPRRSRASACAVYVFLALLLIAPLQPAAADSQGYVEVLPAVLPCARYGASAASDGVNVYIFGGCNVKEGRGPLDEILKFNASTGAVSRLPAKLPNTRWRTCAAWNGTCAYIFGGEWNSSFKSAEIMRFDPASGAITTLPAVLPSARASASAIWNGTYAYIFGGRGVAGDLDQIIRFDPVSQNVSVLSARLPSARSGTSAIWDGEYAYIFGGFGGPPGNFTCYSDILRFNPRTENTTVISERLPSARSGTSAAFDGENAYIFGGYNRNYTCLDEILTFNTSFEEMSPLPVRLPSAASDIASAFAGGRIYLFGGVYSTDLDQVVRFSLSPPPGSNWVFEAAAITGATVAACVIGYAVVRRKKTPGVEVKIYGQAQSKRQKK